MGPSKHSVTTRRGGVNEFVTYRQVYFEEEGYFIKQLRNDRHKICEFKEHVLVSPGAL